MPEPTKEQRAEAYALNEAREDVRAKVMSFPYFQHWLSTGEWINEWPCGSWPALDRFAQALADRDALIAELRARIAELEESEEMACQTPADHCDCPGCSLVAERARTT